MKYAFAFEPEPFGGYSELDVYESFDTESEAIWQSEVSRGSPDYVRWVQRSLNQILGLRLAVDGVIGRQTHSAIRSFQQRQGLRVDGVVGAQTERALRAQSATPSSGTVAPPPQTSAVPSAVPAPTLLSNPEKTPLAYTLYVDIPLNIPLGKAKSMTGIFVPDNYCPLSRVDLIVYLHGWKARSHKAEYSIDAYWRQFLLREEVNKSQKNVILVAPTLGPKNEPGDLIRPAVFDKFLDQVMAALKRYGPYAGGHETPSIGNLILACHSGSGWVMREIAKGSARYATQIQECWAFDSTYCYRDKKTGKCVGCPDSIWVQWPRGRPKPKLYVYYVPGSPTEYCSKHLISQNVPNVLKSIVGHDDVPARYLKERVEGARVLIDKSNCPRSRTNERR